MTSQLKTLNNEVSRKLVFALCKRNYIQLGFLLYHHVDYVSEDLLLKWRWLFSAFDVSFEDILEAFFSKSVDDWHIIRHRIINFFSKEV